MNSQQRESRPAQDSAAAERERVRRVYGAYESDPRYKRMWRDSVAQRFMMNRKWALISNFLMRDGLDMDGARILDLGCGGTGDSDRFVAFGARESGIVALDLIPKNARRTLDSHPAMSAVSADAASLPFRDGSFGIIYQSTMMSSLLDMAVRQVVYAEVGRVLAPGGVFISYDVRYKNPWNPNTRPVKVADLSAAFLGWSLTISSVTAIPQLLRVLAPISLGACRLIELIPPLRTHLLTIVRKPGRMGPIGPVGRSVNRDPSLPEAGGRMETGSLPSATRPRRK